MTRATRTIATVVAALALAGCTASPDPAQPDAGRPGSASPSESPATERPLTAEDGPLNEYRALIYGDGLPPNASEEERNRQYVQQESAMEELIAACMAKQGFDYVPSVRVTDVIESTADDWKPDDREWVAQYGYGISDFPGRTELNRQPEKTEREPMSEAEEQAFQDAMYGSTADGATDWRDRGCRGAAEHEVIGYQAVLDTESQPIVEAINTFYFELYSDPAFASLEAEWAKCMAEHDFPGFRAQRDARQSIEDLRNDYFPADDDSDTPDPRLKDPRFATLDDPAYAEIARQEVALALVDLGCREQTNYNSRHLEIQFELEHRFIADHAEELAAMKARAEQSKK